MAAGTEAWIATVAQRLGDLKDEVVFVGGAVLGLLIDDRGHGGVRPTDDLDVIVNVSSRPRYYDLEARLRERGFRPDTSEGAPRCRWIMDDIVVDVMPADEEILGFTNRWYRGAIAEATEHELEPGLTVRVVSGPHFVATKLEAFHGRGEGDYMSSHDLEDVIAVIDATRRSRVPRRATRSAARRRRESGSCPAGPRATTPDREASLSVSFTV